MRNTYHAFLWCLDLLDEWHCFLPSTLPYKVSPRYCLLPVDRTSMHEFREFHLQGTTAALTYPPNCSRPGVKKKTIDMGLASVG